MLRRSLVILVVLAAPTRAQVTRPNEATITEGRQIYNRSCTICHGPDGAAGDRGPALAGARRYLRASEQDLYESIRNGIAGTEMPPSGLPAADIWKVVAYIRSLRATAYDSGAPGDPASGEKIFWGKGGCGECHVVGGRGGILGPDLSNVGGQRTLKAITDSLTKPRPQIPRGYQPARVVTTDGRVLSGVIRNEHNFSMQLLDRDGKLHLFTRDELREIEHKNPSLMPSDYDKRLSPAEMQDLLAFLSRQASRRVRRERREEDDDEEP